MSSMLVDTHCHVDHESFPEGPDAVLARAREAGVGAFVAIGVGPTTAEAAKAVALASSRPDIVAAVAFHPHDAAHADGAARAEIARLAASDRVAAIGETGLDFHYDQSPREQQREVFRHFIGLARQLRKPLVIHTRSAPAETLQILVEEEARDVGGVIHCFSEDLPFARSALDLNFDLSFSGIVTFKNAKAIQEVAAWAPLSRILVETDSPYLAPVPFRGKRCEPAHVVHTARHVAQLRGISPDALAEATTANALRRFAGLRLADPAAPAP
jgi:TatD DNase family protein